MKDIEVWCPECKTFIIPTLYKSVYITGYDEYMCVKHNRIIMRIKINIENIIRKVKYE